MSDRDRLIEENLKLASWCAHRFGDRRIPYDDREGEALLALVKAANIFDPSRNAKFSTFAIQMMKWRLRQQACREARPVTFPSTNTPKRHWDAFHASDVALTPHAETELPSREPDPETLILRREATERVLAELSPLQREILHLRSAGHGWRDIASALGLSYDEVRKHRYVYSRLRKLVRDNDRKSV